MGGISARSFGSHAMRTLWTFAAIVAVTLGLVLATMGSARATPSPGAVEAQIDEAWNKLEPLIEKYNAVHDQLTAQQTKVKKLKAKIAPLAMKVDLVMARVGTISAQRYMRPTSTVSALLASGSPSAFADQVTILNQVAKNESATVADAIRLKADYDAQKAPIDKLVTSLSQQQATLATQRNAINKQIKDLNKLRLTAYGTTGGTGTYRPATCPQSYDGSPGARAAKVACAQAGKPYVYATAGPDTFDCSGLTQYAWRHGAGVSLPHNAYQQKQVTGDPSITRATLRVGDLVFYYSDIHHVAIYVGGNWVMSAPQTGDHVRMKSISSSPIAGYGRP